MPLPDAINRSPRVYTLLQNQDLENLSADDLADVADPIAIEECNEDELRRLCLVAFARMVTKGSFDGWLTSGGGAAVLGVGAGVKTGANYSTLTKQPPFGRGSPDTSLTWNSNAAFYIPLIAPVTATMDSAILYVTAAATGGTDMLMCVYNSDADTGAPTTQLSSEITVEGDATGFIEVDFTTPPDLEVGKLYYFGMAKTTSDNTLQLRAHLTENETNFGGQEYSSDYNRNILTETGVDNSLPATATAANILGATYGCPVIMVSWS